MIRLFQQSIAVVFVPENIIHKMGYLPIQIYAYIFMLYGREMGQIQERVNTQDDMIENVAFLVLSKLIGLVKDGNEGHGIIVIMYMMIY